MDRRSMLALSGTALTVGLAGCSAFGSPDDTDAPTDEPTDGSTDTPTETPTAEPTDEPTDTPTEPDSDVPPDLANGGFEADWAAWSVGRDLPVDPNREGDRAVASEAGVTTRDASEGVTACRLFVDGSQDDGTLWVQQPVDLADFEHLAVDYVVSDSFNERRNAALYAGPRPEEPLTETDFDTSQSLDGHSAPGWKTLTADVDHDGPGLVAVGFSVVWETGLEALLDDVRLTAEPPSTTTPAPQSTDDDGST